ncbi:hypothetical protein FJ365_04460 [Candidatus Dependentiae bacterium]|nr:hypothetical protein [Candidatus Dependentiae bacterium]
MKKLLYLLALVMLGAPLNAYTPFLYFGNEVFSLKTPTSQYLTEEFMGNKEGRFVPSLALDTSLQYGSFLWQPGAHRSRLLVGQATYNQKIDGLVKDLSFKGIAHGYVVGGGKSALPGFVHEITAVADYLVIEDVYDKLSVNLTTIFPIMSGNAMQREIAPQHKPIPGFGFTAIKRLFGNHRRSVSLTAEGQYHVVPVHTEVRKVPLATEEAVVKIDIKEHF